jgi:hypothetical protein
VTDGVTVVVDSAHALAQLCAPASDAGTLALPVAGPGECDEDVLYRCSGGVVVSCEAHAVVGRCARGCFAEGSDIGVDVPVGREAAFAILCSR